MSQTGSQSMAVSSRTRRWRRSGLVAVLGVALSSGALTTGAVASAASEGPAIHAPAAATSTIPTSAGRDFWLAGPPAAALAGDVIPAWDLYVSASKSGSVTVQVPGLAGGAWSTTVSVTAGRVTKVDLPDGSTIPQPTEGADPVVSDLGIHVTSTVDVSVYGQSPEGHYRCGYLGLPVANLGTRYRVLSYMSPQGLGSYVAVVGTQNGTSVTLTMTDGTTETVTLDQGETVAYAPPTFELDVPWNFVTDESDATGIVVTSTKPVGVFGGAYIAAVPYNAGNMNAMAQMMPPTSTWGTEFLAVRMGTRIKGDRYRVLADKDDTEVSVNGSVVQTLDAGDFYEFAYPEAASVSDDENIHISATKPILVGQFGTGLLNEFDDFTDVPSGYYADPLYSLVPSREQYLNSYVASLPNMVDGSAPGVYWANLVVPTDVIASVRLNGAAVAGAEFSSIGDSGFSGAQVSLPTFGTYRVTADKPFGLSLYAWGNDDAIGFPAGLALSNIANVASASLDDPTVSGSGTDGSYPEAEVSVENAGGNPVPGVAVIFQVSDAGDNNQVVTAFTNAQGLATVELPGEAPESGTLTVGVGAVEVSGTITWSTKVPQVPTAPQLTISPKDGALQATWKASSSSGSSAINQYKIVAMPGGKFCTVTPKAGQKAFNCTITGLTNRKQYTLESYARNDAGWSESDTFGPKSPASTPAKPRGLAVVSKSADGSLTIEWDEPSDDGGAKITSYDVLWRLRDATKYATKPKVTAKTFTIKDLKPGARYRVAVAARNVVGRGQETFFIVKMPS